MCGLWPLRTSGQNTLFKIQYYLTTLQNKHNYGGRKHLQDTQSSCKVDDNQFWTYLWKQALTYLQHKCSELDLEIRPELDNETSIRLFSPSKVLKLKLSLCVRSDWVWWGVIPETLLWWYNDIMMMMTVRIVMTRHDPCTMRHSSLDIAPLEIIQTQPLIPSWRCHRN